MITLCDAAFGLQDLKMKMSFIVSTDPIDTQLRMTKIQVALSNTRYNVAKENFSFGRAPLNVKSASDMGSV